MGYTKDAVKGISWLGFFRVATRLISYVRIAILARILTPKQFGLSDIALLVLSITEVFTETGINIFLVQQKENIDKYINTAWVVSILRGFIIAGVIILLTPFISNFFNASGLSELLYISSVVPILRGFINPSVVKFVKELQFYKEFYYRTAIFFVESVISVIAAFLIHSPLAIIYGLIAGALFEVVMSFFIVRPLPLLRYENELFRHVINRGKWLTLTGIFNYLYHNGDNVVVGKILGPASLGLYQRAYSLSSLPITEISDVFSKVTFPIYVKMTDDIKRLKRAYIRSLFIISVIVIPIGVLLYLFPEFIITFILGNQWVAATPVLKVLAIFGVIRAISISAVAPFYALNRQELVTHVTFVGFAGLVITIVPFVMTWGLVGAAYSALVGTILSLPLIIYYLHKVFPK